MYSSLLVTLSVFASVGIAAPQTHTFEKRGQTFTCGTSKIALRLEPGSSTKAVSQQTCLDVNNGNAPYYTYTDGDTTAQKTTTTTTPADSTCEHIMEVQLLKQVLESAGGPCDQLAAADPSNKQTMRANFKTITDILNSAPNLVFAENTLEHQKGDMVNKAQQGASGKPYTDNPKAPDPNLRNRLEAVDNFVNTQTKEDSVKVAADLDAQIAKLFPGTTAKVADKWNSILQFASTCYSGLSSPQCPASGDSSKRQECVASSGLTQSRSPTSTSNRALSTSAAATESADQSSGLVQSSSPTSGSNRGLSTSVVPTGSALESNTAQSRSATQSSDPATARSQAAPSSAAATEGPASSSKPTQVSVSKKTLSPTKVPATMKVRLHSFRRYKLE